MKRRDIIVVGASAGGLGALQTFIGGLPHDLAAAVFVVLHIGARRSAASAILNSSGPLPVAKAVDGGEIRNGHIHVAPPDYHLLLEPGCMRLTRGPRENRTRPAVDPLFRTAAEAYGSRVVGIIMSGTLSDGTAGFSAIRRCGGVTVVQDPDEAEYPGMPRNALRYVGADHCLPVAAIPDLVVRLSGGCPAETSKGAKEHSERLREPEKDDEVTGKYEMNQPVALTCPSCGGSLKETMVGQSPYYTCHIGHRFAIADMDAGQVEKLEESFEIALRTLNERAGLCRRMAEMALSNGHTLSSQRWDDARAEAEEKANVLKRFLEHDWISQPSAEDAW
ncbi:chemotaxis protein CheB [Skermanella mucosa]|uniref:chemotaxis protein CheB n=1 Tax=Skermanella mucosa TaxID=1789672 RepID=UPI00192C1F3C|nr:chemotaxis protein CheB [Skermanella mucosa]UEM19712.1 chemotaxis protein CheB [Skermanella mucosa]